MAERSKILDRIEKLLRRTKERGASEAEVEAAMDMAQRLMEKHNIEMAELHAENKRTFTDKDVVDEAVRRHSALEKWEEQLLVFVGKLCNVEVYVTRHAYTGKHGELKWGWTQRMYGIGADIEIARCLYTELLFVLPSMARANGITKQFARKKYCYGYVTGMRAKAEAREREMAAARPSTCTALITTKQLAVRDYAKKNLKLEERKTQSHTQHEGLEFYQGYRDGQEHDVIIDRSSKLTPEPRPNHPRLA